MKFCIIICENSFFIFTGFAKFAKLKRYRVWALTFGTENYLSNGINLRGYSSVESYILKAPSNFCISQKEANEIV